MNHYDRVAGVIQFLDEHHTDQPDLRTVAKNAGLSPFHLHRLFAAWAGVTPKDFLQCLTLSHARGLLETGAPVLGASLEAGLSGPGRLHDLCVSLEAASPGEIKAGGAGLDIVFGFAPTPFGECLLAESARGICDLSFVVNGDRRAARDALERNWPAARLIRDDTAAVRRITGIFTASPLPSKRPAIRAYVKGTPFQVRVWRALLEIPAGSLTTYNALAGAVGNPGAARAAGTAVGRNALAYLIPCHRVIRATGLIGGYRWGTVRKKAILAFENASRLAPQIPAGSRNAAIRCNSVR